MQNDGQLPLFYKRFLIVLTFIIVCMLAFVAVKIVQPAKVSASVIGYNLYGFGTTGVNADYCPIDETINGFPVYYASSTDHYLWQGYSTTIVVDSVLQNPITGAVIYYTGTSGDFSSYSYPYTDWVAQSGSNPVGQMTEISCDSGESTSTATTTPVTVDMVIVNFVMLMILFILIVVVIVKAFVLFKYKRI